ncbi:hypothetical protein PIB19_17610 [Sphingomonas sp. 7/4-4]|uniref:hypothetical protein n=1 Tax=Sphingomonas sp. 7/4-4 TaxID=3018446 RepID=UPI0022F3F5B6|nr:hypothetical protein [Sphingomonas sp. 7/4-4]WBY07200.1 hypothetical protein PIB19_17610 [Sphingomonas sp. 7/4-4]
MNLIWLFFQYGLEGTLDVDGGGGATIGILLFLSIFGLAVGFPIAALTRALAPKSWLIAFSGIAAFCAIGGWLSATPVYSFEGWTQGATLSLAFAGLAIVAGAGLQRLRSLVAGARRTA